VSAPGFSDQETTEKAVPSPGENELRMSFLDHLSELAARLKKCLYAFIISLVVVTSIPYPLQPFGGPHSIFGYNFLITSLIIGAQNYYLGPNPSILAVQMTDPVSVFINVSLILGLVVALPYIFYQIYGFVAPGLYQREKKAVRKYILPFSLLFISGAIFGIIVVSKLVMRILLIFYNALGVIPAVPLASFINLILLIPVATGLAFTFPVFLIPLVELKILSVKQLSSARKWVYVLTALIVGIIDPDPTFITVIPIIVPIYVLFEITVYISKRIERKRAETQVVDGNQIPQ